MPDTFDVAIVGGGISGLYAAWRLATQTDGPPLKVCLHEVSDRLGGRLDTRDAPGMNARVELGAMRFPPSHEMVQALLEELKLPTEPFPAQNFLHMYLRGTPLAMPPATGGLPSVTGLPYRLAGTEATHPYVLLVQALLRILPPTLQIGQNGFEQLGAPGKPISAADWDLLLAGVTVEGKPLWQWGFWNLLNRVMSNEAYQYLLDAFGVESAVSNWNALLAIRLLCTILGDCMNNHLMHVVGGWVELVNALEAKLSQLPNVTLVKHSSLIAAAGTDPKAQPGSPLQLTFWDKKVNTIEIPDPNNPGATLPLSIPSFTAVFARNLILAMPPRSIELLNLDGLQAGLLENTLSPQMRQVLRIPAFKSYISFPQAWWQQWCGWTSGFSVTDLPLRQVFYGAGFAPPPAPAVQGAALVAPPPVPDGQRILMAAYADASTVDFWSGLVGVGQRVQEFNGADANKNLPLRQVMERELKELHGYEFDFPAGEWACTVDWTADPFGAGWHAWRPNVNVTTQIPAMRTPLAGLGLPNTNVFICGEAFSHVQGWVEGALTSAEMLLEEQFKLTRPIWIPADYPLGPAEPAPKPAQPAPKSTTSTGS